MIVSLICSFGLNAQEWFLLGASWYYNHTILQVGETYQYFEVTGEINIQGHNCKIVAGQCNCTPSGIGTYLFEEGDKIFVFDSQVDSFKLLYDFNRVAGDTLIFHGDSSPGEDGKYLIDSVTVIQAGSETLRVQHITHLAFELVWGDKIIERISSNGCLFPQVSFCDPGTGGLRCYEDDETGLLNFQTPPRPCDYVTEIEESNENYSLNIYPNPATNSIHIQSGKPIERLIMFNYLAIPVFQQYPMFNKEFEFDVPSLPGGLYIIQAILSDHQIIQRSIIIQKCFRFIDFCS